MHCGRGVAGVILGLLGMVMSCASRQSDRADPLAVAPDDFSLELSVLAPREPIATRSAILTQSRYVLSPDGAFRYEADPAHQRGQTWLPPLTRVLNRRQVAQIWSVARDLGLTEPMSNRQSEAFSFRMVRPADNTEIVHLAGFTADGQRWAIERRSPLEQADPAMQELTRLLAQFAWADDDPPGPVQVVPRRYDFGPDPYASYRSSNAGDQSP